MRRFFELIDQSDGVILEVADQIAPIRDRLAAHFRTWSGLFEACIADAQHTGRAGGPLAAFVDGRNKPASASIHIKASTQLRS